MSTRSQYRYNTAKANTAMSSYWFCLTCGLANYLKACITYQVSRGGVFIATLFGLGLAMVTLAWEVFYYKRKERNMNKAKTIDKEAFAPKVVRSKMADGVAKLRKRGKENPPRNVTIGDKFKPVVEKPVSFINVYPKGGYRP
ncbi:unnamed protein product, partial [Iphiclides podalirius]